MTSQYGTPLSGRPIARRTPGDVDSAMSSHLPDYWAAVEERKLSYHKSQTMDYLLYISLS